MNTTINADGDHKLELPQGFKVTQHSASVVRILHNLDGATVLLGEDDGTGTISLFANGDITAEGAGVNHGKGAALMVRVAGLAANPLVVSVKEV